MRARTSAVVMLVATLFASPVSGFTCLFDCEAPARVAQAQPADDSAAGAGTCHRGADEFPGSDVSISAAPHDCGSHAAPARTLTVPKSMSILSQFSMQVALAGYAGALETATTQPSFGTRDLARPGSGPHLIAPLRI